MTLFRHEFMKLFGSRHLLLLAAGLLVLNGFLLSFYENNDRRSVPYSISAYNKLHADMQGIPDRQLEAELERQYRQLLVFMDLELQLTHPAYAAGGNVEEQLSARYPDVDIAALTIAYSRGEHLKYAEDTFGELRLIQTTLDQVKKVNGYDAYLRQMADDAETRSSISVFARPDSFAYRNLILTARDYASMAGTELSYDRSEGIRMATRFPPTDILALSFIAIAAVILVTREKENQLLAFVRSTYKGGGPLIAAKLMVITVVSAGMGLLLYAVNYAIAYWTYGFGDWSRSLQSVAGHYESTWTITTGQFLLLFLPVKLLVYITAALIITAIAVFCRRSLTVYISIVALFGLSAFLYLLVPPSSAMALLKHLNLVAFLNTYSLFASYLNLNVAGYPVHYRIAFALAIAAAIIVSLVAIVRMFRSRNVVLQRLKSAGRIKGKWKERWGYYAHTGLFRHEAYKMLIANKAIVVLALFAVFQMYNYQPVAERLGSKDDVYYKQYMLQLEGEWTPDKERIIREEQRRFDEALEEMRRISDVPYAALFQLTQQLDKQAAFDRVKAHSDYLQQMESRYGVYGWFLYDEGYRLLTAGNEVGTGNDWRHALLLAIVLIAALSMVFTYELHTHMIRVIGPTLRGGRDVMLAKLTGSALIGTLVYAGVYGPPIIGVLRAYGTRALHAPAFSMPHLAEAGAKMTIMQYLVVIGAIRWVGVVAVILTVYVISIRLRSPIFSALASTGAIALPLIMSIIGIHLFDYIGLTPVLAGNVWFKVYSYELLQQNRAWYAACWLLSLLLPAALILRKLRRGGRISSQA